MTIKFALLSYSTNNLGDEVQSIAARQFLRSTDLLVDRDEWTTCPANIEGTFKIILNGWFTHSPHKWPPPSILSPLLISMHISKERYRPTALVAPSQALVAGENLAYLKRHEPVGARDLWTVSLLQQHGVSSYFSGCVTLTLGSDCKRPRGGYICAVDLPEELHRYLVERARSPILRLSHHDSSGGPFERRCAAAGQLLSLYAHAQCVVTTRLHCALPCIAFGTPILLIGDADYYRFSGLINLVRHCSMESFKKGEVDFDFDEPPANSGAHMELRESLIAKLEAFTGRSIHPFRPVPPEQLRMDRPDAGIG